MSDRTTDQRRGYPGMKFPPLRLFGPHRTRELWWITLKLNVRHWFRITFMEYHYFDARWHWRWP